MLTSSTPANACSDRSPTKFRRILEQPATCSAAIAGVLLASSIGAHAVGFRLPNQDPEGIARGNAFAATADNPSAIYYNPAGITQIHETQARVGAYLISASTEYVSPTGKTAHTDTRFQMVPQIYFVTPIKDTPLTFGLGVYAPYGLSLDWGKSTSFNNLAQSGKLLYATVNPVVAWKIDEKLSLGIGPTINYSEVTFQNAVLRFKGNDAKLGFNAGLRWQATEKWAFGANYRYTTTLNYSGDSTIAGKAPTKTEAAITFPQFVAVGASFRPTTNWNFEVNIDWTDWDNVNQAVFKGTSVGNIPFPFNYESSLMYEFGITRKLDNGYYVSTGYIFSENSSPAKNFSPLVPDSNLHLGSIGFGHKGNRWDWALGYHFAYSPDRRVFGSTPGFGQTADGLYQTLNHAFNIALTYKY